MAQIVFPTDFAAQLVLLDNVISKNTELGTKSPLAAWLKAKNMNLAAFKVAGGQAQTCEDQKLSGESLSEQSNQERDKLFAPVFQFLMQGAQSLKKWYDPTFAALKDWGIPITGSGRIDYPSSFEDRSAIASKFFEKYDSFEPDANPLAAFVSVNETNVPLLEANLADAIKKNTLGITNAKLAENATAQRNKYWADAAAGLRDIGEYLKSVYVKEVRMLGEWGFVVDESKPVIKKRKVKFKIGQTKIVDNVPIGSILINLGKSDAIVHKGKTTEGEMTILKMNDKMGMISGYSSITVVNPSTLETFTLSIEPPEN